MLKEYIQTQAAAKHKKPKEWLFQQARNAQKCSCATHIGRFTHPSVNVTYYDKKDTDTSDDYVTTSSVHCSADIAITGGAACMPAVKLLQYPLEDGRTVLEHLQSEPDFLQRELGEWPIDHMAIQKDLLSVTLQHVPTASDNRLRQGYFPVADSYHLLTVLPSSSVALELRRRVRVAEEEGRKARDSKDPAYGTSYPQLLDLTEMSFGGTKPQNISYLNLQHGGRLSVLPSVPPVLHLRHVKVPRRDFFRETLQRWQYREDCERLSKLYREVRNNMELRRRARRREQLLIAKAMLPVYQLRSSLEPGWSQDGQCALPQAQKVWLDEVYAETRWQDISWQTEIAKAFTRWLMQTRESFEGHDKIVLGNAEFLALQKQVLQAVQETGGMVQEP